jgi:O-antigen ligase
MFHSDAARIASVERVGAPRLSIGAGLLGAFLTGYLLTVSPTVALGFLGFQVLLCVTVLHPVSLIPLLLVLPVFMEASLKSLSITMGGRELLNFYGVVNLSLFAAITFYTLTERMRPFESLLIRPFAFFYAAVLFSVLFSADTQMTARSIVRIASGPCVYLMITQLITEKRQIDRLFQILVISSAIPIAVGLYQIAFRNHFVISRDLRIKGTITNGMSYAMYMAVILPCIFGQVVFAKGGRLRRGLFAALFLAGLVNLLYASTRIGWGVFALTMILYGLFTDARRLLPVILTVLIVGVILFLPFFAKSFGGFFETDWSTYLSNDIRWDFRSAEYITASSLHIRIVIWRNMFHQLMASNPLFGVGSGTWFENFDLKMLGFPMASHSDYFEVLFGTGFVGLFFYLVFRFKQLILLGRFARSGVERHIKTTVLFPCLAIHIAALGMSITEVWQAYACIYWISWIMIGICEVYYRWYSEQESPRETIPEIPPDVAYN